MGMRINTNMAAISAMKNMAKPQDMLEKALTRLSSGKRIAKASYDAAGLAISNRMQAQTRSMSQAIRNANDGISATQTAEGAQSQVSDMVGRIRELSVQAANGTLSPQDRAAIQAEVDGLTDEIDRIGQTTEFNGRRLLDGSFSTDLQVGDDPGDTVSVAVGEVSSASLGLDNVDVTTPQGAAAAIESADRAVDRVSSSRADLGAVQNRLQSTISNLRQSHENMSEANSRIMDADMAAESAMMVKGRILADSSISVLSQANMSPQGALRLL